MSSAEPLAFPPEWAIDTSAFRKAVSSFADKCSENCEKNCDRPKDHQDHRAHNDPQDHREELEMAVEKI